MQLVEEVGVGRIGKFSSESFYFFPSSEIERDKRMEEMLEVRRRKRTREIVI